MLGKFPTATTPMPQIDKLHGKKLSSAQRVAESTYGIATIPNLISAAGLGLVIAGCNQIKQGNISQGVGAIAIGAACDVLDGFVARKTRVANYPAGRWCDSITDGAKSAILIKTALAANLLSPTDAAIIYAPKAAGWAVNGIAKFALHQEPYTLPIGKVAEASRWTALAATIGLSLARTTEQISPYSPVNLIGKVAVTAAGILGTSAALAYYKNAKHANDL